MKGPIIIPVHTQPRQRDCIVVDQKVFCERADDNCGAACGGLILLGFIVMGVWLVIPMVTAHLYEWTATKAWCWYLIPPLLIVLAMIALGSW